jgi:hypothetical protein
MNLPKEYRQIIINEFEEIENRLPGIQFPQDKLYFFTAAFGIINRVFNIHFDPLLVFMHQILNSAHIAISERYQNHAPTLTGGMPQEMIDLLFVYLSELKIAFQEEDENKIRSVLEKFSILSYAVTGNGFYLYLKGVLTLDTEPKSIKQ